MKGLLRCPSTRIGAVALFAIASSCIVNSACSARGSKQAVRHITYWEKWTGFEGEAMDAVVADFNALELAHAKSDPAYVPIEVEKVTISKLEQKLLIAIAGGNPPDLAGNYSFAIAAYAHHGALSDLGPLIAKSNFDRSRYIEHFLRLGEYRGRTWALPIVPASTALVLNKRLFRDAGLDPEKPPTTIEELDAYAEKLTKWEVTSPSGEKHVESGYLPDVPATQKRLLQVGFLPNEPHWWMFGWGDFFGGRLLESSDKVSSAAAANIRAFEWVASYSQKLGVDVIKRFRSGFGNSSSPQNAFLSGKVAMEMQGVWIHNFVEKYAPGLSWAAAPFPYPADHPELAGTTRADADMLMIPKGSAHPEEAWRFIQFASTQAELEKLCLGQQKFTPLTEVSERFWAAHPNPSIRLFRQLAVSKNAVSIPRTEIWNEYNRELGNATDLIQNLKQTPASALTDVQTKMQAALDRDREIQARRQAR
ncbi:MAG TPA: ABC transporter substrate-binding protein [Polyangiaceae bacterium]|nr:ABC transporter substrate-binding protein [Polyangiaceae bacterium]